MLEEHAMGIHVGTAFSYYCIISYLSACARFARRTLCYNTKPHTLKATSHSTSIRECICSCGASHYTSSVVLCDVYRCIIPFLVAKSIAMCSGCIFRAYRCQSLCQSLSIVAIFCSICVLVQPLRLPLTWPSAHHDCG